MENKDFYQPEDDLNSENPPPRPGSLGVARWLSRHPREVLLWNTSDDSPCPFLDDGGKVENGVLTKPGQHRQLLWRAAHRAREDEAFKGTPLFVAKEPIPPAFVGDPLCTTNFPGGRIQLWSPEFAELVKASLKVRQDRIDASRALGLSTLDKLRSRNADPVSALTEALSAALSNATGAGGTSPELEALRKQNEELAAQLKKAQAAQAPAESKTSPEDKGEAPKGKGNKK